MTNERRIAEDIHAETITGFKGFTIQSTISDSAHSDSEEVVDAVSDSEELVYALSDSKELVDAVSDPKRDPNSDPKVATYTTNRNFHKNYSTTGSSQRLSQTQSV